MELYLDSADLNGIETLATSLPIQGVTTNPSILAKQGIQREKAIPALRQLLGPKARLFAQVNSLKAIEMVEEATQMNKSDPFLVVKIPVNHEGLTAIRELSKHGIATLGTAVYSPMQGLLAALAGASYVAPYVNRIDAQGGSGIRCVEELQTLLTLHAPSCKILAASFKSPRQVLDCLLTGCASVTVPLEVARQWLVNPAVEGAVEQFHHDWEQSIHS